MASDELLGLAQVRPWGTILLGRHVRCDGRGQIESDITKRRLSCYSHIHADHLTGFQDSLHDSDVVLVSKETKELLIEWKGPWLKKKNNFIGIDFHEPIEFHGDVVTLLPSGHILGSAQVLVESSGKKILYSGDFNMPEATVVGNVDVLVIDSTHGESRYKTSPPPERQLDYLVRLTKEELNRQRPVIIRASKGKIQYLMHHLRNHVRINIPFVSNMDDAALAKAYTKFGMPCEELIDEESLDFQAMVKKNEPYIRFSPSTAAAIPYEMQGVRSIQVGLPTTYSNPTTNMYQISLSDHANYGGILEYISKLNPQLVITDNSGRVSEQTAVHLSETIRTVLGIDSVPQGKPIQR